MAWIRIDDHFDEHPKLAAVGPLGWGIWLAGLAYSNRNLTDGFIPWAKARALVTTEMADEHGAVWELGVTSGYGGTTVDGPWLVDLMVRAGLWKTVQNGDQISGYQIHDYTDYQPTRAEILAERARSAQRQSAFRQRVAKRNGKSNAVTTTVSNAHRNAVSNAPVTPAPSSTDVQINRCTDVKAQPTVEPLSQVFDELWKSRPRRAGSDPKGAAKRAWNARIREKIDPQAILTSYDRYRHFCQATGKLGTETVMRCSTFLGDPSNFENEWAVPPPRINEHPGRDRQHRGGNGGLEHVDPNAWVWNEAKQRMVPPGSQ